MRSDSSVRGLRFETQTLLFGVLTYFFFLEHFLSASISLSNTGLLKATAAGILTSRFPFLPCQCNSFVSFHIL